MKNFWIDAKEKPTPEKDGVKCDRFITIDLGDYIQFMYYFYENDIWSINSDDTQKIKFWAKLPKLENK